MYQEDSFGIWSCQWLLHFHHHHGHGGDATQSEQCRWRGSSKEACHSQLCRRLIQVWSCLRMRNPYLLRNLAIGRRSLVCWNSYQASRMRNQVARRTYLASRRNSQVFRKTCQVSRMTYLAVRKRSQVFGRTCQVVRKKSQVDWNWCQHCMRNRSFLSQVCKIRPLSRRVECSNKNRKLWSPHLQWGSGYGSP